MNSRAQQVREQALALGFDRCGIAAAEAIDPEDRLGQWLEQGFHADMEWMARTRAVRQDIQLKLPGAKSVVVVARNYKQPSPPHAEDALRVARYAWGRDYHKVMKRPLRKLASWMTAMELGARCDIGVDASPFLERAWAAKAGVGWIGRNAMVLNREMGSWFLLGVVATTLELEPDAPVQPNCGTCRACMDACPTGAIVADGVVDSNKCISYQTIENRGEIPDAIAERMNPWVFGCDICQEVCPWNRFARDTTEADFAARPEVAFPDAAAVMRMDEGGFLQTFAGTPVMRTKLSGLQRNVRLIQEYSRDIDVD
jgi:epoxyqueuosine reductase